MSNQQPENPALRLLALAAITAAIATIFTSLHITAHHYVPLLFQDEWDMVAGWSKVQEGTSSFLEALFSQHNEHRIALPRLVFYVDLSWFQGRGILTLACLIAVHLFHALFLCVLVFRALKLDFWVRIVVGSLIIIMMFSALQIRNLVWGFQLQFVGVFALSTLAFYCLFKRSDTQTGIDTPATRLPFVGGILLSVGATFTMANGLLTWPVGLLIGLQQRWSFAKLLLFIAFGCATWFGYFHDFEFNTGHTRPEEALENIWLLAEYMAIYIGHPLSPQWPDYALALGMTGISATAVMTIVSLLDKSNLIFDSQASRTLLTVSIFVLLTAFITSLGRIGFGLEQATSSRYATPAIIFWISTLACLFTLNTTKLASKKVVPYFGAFLILLAVTSALTFQTSAPVISKQWSLLRLASASALLSRVYDEGLLSQIHPHPWDLDKKTEALQNRGLNFFSIKSADLIGKPLLKRLELAPRSHCTGHIDEVKMVKSDKNGVRLTGWAVNRQAQKRANTVLFVVDETINGIAFSGKQRPDVEKIFPEISDSGWLGYAKIWPGETLQAYAVVSDGQAACLLNGVYQHQAKN